MRDVGRMHARAWWLVGIAFFGGLALSAALLYEGSFFGAPPDALAVRITNVGTRDANVTMEVGNGLARWAFALPAGATEERRLEAPPRAQLAVRATVVWEAPADGGRGTVTVIADGRDCPGGLLLASLRVDTSVGVSFPEAAARCQ